jgi:hypothetical protein
LAVWEGLRQDTQKRQAFWQQWVHTPLSARDLAAVRRSVIGGRPYGAAGWVQTTAQRLGLALERRPRGPPTKQSQTEK